MSFSIIGAALGGIGSAATGVAGAVGSAAGAVGSALGTAGSAVGGALGSAGSAIGSEMSQAGSLIGQAGSGAWQGVQQAMGGGGSAGGMGGTSTATGNLVGTPSANSLASTATQNATTSPISQYTNGLVQKKLGPVSNVVNDWSSMVDGFKDPSVSTGQKFTNVFELVNSANDLVARAGAPTSSRSPQQQQTVQLQDNHFSGEEQEGMRPLSQEGINYLRQSAMPQRYNGYK